MSSKDDHPGFSAYDKGSREDDRRPGRPKTQKFHGNQWTEESETQGTSSASQRKVRNSAESVPTVSNDFCYVLLEFFTVFHFLENVVKCKTCGGDVNFERSHQRGLGFKNKVRCDGPCPDQSVQSCPFAKNAYEVNIRVSFAMRMLGVAYAGLRAFCRLMDMATPVVESFYSLACNKIRDSCRKISEISMNKAAKEEKNLTIAANNYLNPSSVGVSSDGSWMKRGFTSLHGIVGVIGLKSGKVLDCVIKSACCKSCEYWESKAGEEPEAYDEYVNNHYPVCNANYEGTSGGTEVSRT